MKITKKQKSEIDFMYNYVNEKFIPTTDEIEDYIQRTVYGYGSRGVIYGEKNKLWIAKRQIDMVIKEWRIDMQKGYLAYFELLEDCNNHPYMRKILKRLAVKPSLKYDINFKNFYILAWLNYFERDTLKFPF